MHYLYHTVTVLYYTLAVAIHQHHFLRQYTNYSLQLLYTHLPATSHCDHHQFILWVFLPHPPGTCSLETRDVLHLPPHTPLHSRRASLWTKQNICLQEIQDNYIFLDNYHLTYTIAEVK